MVDMVVYAVPRPAFYTLIVVAYVWGWKAPAVAEWFIERPEKAVWGVVLVLVTAVYMPVIDFLLYELHGFHILGPVFQVMMALFVFFLMTAVWGTHKECQEGETS